MSLVVCIKPIVGVPPGHARGSRPIAWQGKPGFAAFAAGFAANRSPSPGSPYGLHPGNRPGAGSPLRRESGAFRSGAVYRACICRDLQATLFLGGDLARRRCHHRIGDGAGIAADRLLDLLADLRVLLQIGFGVLAALADALAVIGEPCAGFFDDAGLDAEIDQFAAFRDALAVHDVEIDDLERRRHLVLDDLDPGLVADHLVAVLDRTDAADIEPYGGIEFQRLAAGRRFRVAEHDADLHADLIDKDHHAARARDRAGQ